MVKCQAAKVVDHAELVVIICRGERKIGSSRSFKIEPWTLQRGKMK